MKVYAFARPAAGGGIGALHLPPAPAVFPASAAGAVIHVPQGTRRALPRAAEKGRVHARLFRSFL